MCVWVANATPRPLYPRERDSGPFVWEAAWAPGPAWTGAENLAPTGIRSPDRPARSESLYRLSYRGPRIQSVTTKFQKGNRKGNMFETRAKFFSCGDERAVRRRRLKNIVR